MSTSGRNRQSLCPDGDDSRVCELSFTATDLTELQAQLDTFRDYYNTVRPHRALHRHTPAEAYTARPKAAPSGIALIDVHYRVRQTPSTATGPCATTAVCT